MLARHRYRVFSTPSSAALRLRRNLEGIRATAGAGMSKRRWTIVVVPQGSSATKNMEVSNTALKLVGSVAVAATMLVLLLGYATLRRSLNLADRKSTRLNSSH